MQVDCGGCVLQQISFPKFKKQDPAPSRLRYKLSRWMLSPFVKKAIFYGFPLIFLATPILIYFQDQKSKEQLEKVIIGTRTTIHGFQRAIRQINVETNKMKLQSKFR